MARQLRASPVPVVVAVNKADAQSTSTARQSSMHFGLGSHSRFRATHGMGTGDLLDRIVEALGDRPPRIEDDGSVRVAVIGRPNVGKSSLVNRMLGDDRVIVSEVAGTTPADAIDTEVEVDGRRMVLVDTAGLRRKSKVAGTVDHYAQLRLGTGDRTG